MFLIVGGDSEIGAAAFAALKSAGPAAAATTRRRGPVAHDRLFLDLGGLFERLGAAARALHRHACVPRSPGLPIVPPTRRASAHINVTQTLALVDKLLGRGIYVLFLVDQPGIRWQRPAGAARRAAFTGQRIRPAKGPH